MLKTKLLVSLFAYGFMALSGSSLEARHHSHSSVNVQINAGAPVRHVYTPAPVVVQTAPVYVQTAPTIIQRPIVRHQVVETPTVVQQPVIQEQVAIHPQQYYTVPATYVVQPQPVVVVEKRTRPTFNWGFNWGFFFR